jgi:hypothetical protein
VLSGGEALCVVVQGFGAQQVGLERDLVGEPGIGDAGVSLDQLGVEMPVLGGAGDGAAGTADDMPGQGSP